MVFGHNSNVTHGQAKYHVQTEDAGIGSALIDTTVYCGGRVLHRRTNNYLDLLPLNADREAALKLRVAEQHRQVLEEIRSGTLYLPAVAGPVPAAPFATAAASVIEKAASAPQTAKELLVELLNAKSWLSGKRATLHLRISDHSGQPVCDAKIIASVAGAAEPSDFFAESDATGEAHLAFDMPRLNDPNAALRIEAIHAFGAGHLRFQLRARQRVPVVQG